MLIKYTFYHILQSNCVQNKIFSYQNLQILGQDNWKSITDDMVKLIWYGRSPQNSKYSYLADFFGEVGELFEDRNNYFLSALFHTMATGEVPSSIWNKYKFQAKYFFDIR